MKPLFLFLFTFYTLVASSTPNNDEKVSPVVVASFRKVFANASEVNWTETESFYKAQFQLNQQYVAAFFSKSGEILGISKNISSAQLPVILQTGLKAVLQQGWIIELFEFSNDNNVTYYMTVENTNEKITLHSVNNEWHFFQKQIKP